VPLLTVITISKNYPSGFKRTLHSLLSAGLKTSSVKLLVINGGTESSLKSEIEDLGILNSDSIDIFTGIDNGIFNAMNQGLSMVFTPYVLFLNSGDEISRDFNFDQLISEIKKCDASWMIAKASFTTPTGEIRSWKSVKPLSLKHRLGLNSFPHHGTIYKTDFIKQNGGFVESTPFADWELSVHLSKIEVPAQINIEISFSEPFNYSESFSNHEWAKKICESRMRLSLTSTRLPFLKVKYIYLLKVVSVLKNRLLFRLRLI
jgi:glycosyltransferase involved in cell wall biosynthesis